MIRGSRGKFSRRSSSDDTHSPGVVYSPNLGLGQAKPTAPIVSFRQYYQNEEFSDVVVSLLAPDSKTEADSEQSDAGSNDASKQHNVEIQRFPAHKLVLATSPYFKAQLLRWQQQADQDQQPPTATLILDSADQLPAALAVLEAMYGVRPPDVRDRLTDAQLVQMVIVADMLQLSDIANYAVACLQSVAARLFGLTKPAKDLLYSLPAWPHCLLSILPQLAHGMRLSQLLAIWVRSVGCAEVSTGVEAVLATQHGRYIQQVLVDQLGALEAAWVNDQQRELLLGLPLPAMQLLLASGNLKVTNEDSVLCVAQAYNNKQPTPQQQQAAQTALAPHIRCTRLSPMWLTAMVTSHDADKMLLSQYIPQIKLLLQLRHLTAVQPFYLHGLVPDVPGSWLLLARQPTAPVSAAGASTPTPQPPLQQQRDDPWANVYDWQLPVADLRSACEEASSTGEVQTLVSPGTTPPVTGLVWRLKLQCVPVKETGVSFSPGLGFNITAATTTTTSSSSSSQNTGANTGSNNKAVQLELSVVADDAPRGLLVHVALCYNCIVCGGKGELVGPCEKGWVVSDPFKLGPMNGGWDAAAWKARGLPKQGACCIKLTVKQPTTVPNPSVDVQKW